MQKSLLFISIIAASLFLSIAILAQTEGSCTPQFSISSPESVDMSKTSIWVDIAVTNTGSCEGSTTVYPLMPEGWFSGLNFTTKTLQAGESENSSIKIMTSNTNSATIQFIADGANVSPTKIVIGGVVPEEVSNPPQQNQTQTQPPAATIPIAPAKNDSVINVPQENAQQEPNETGAAQNQEVVPTTGLVTANPSAQIAIFAILLFGAGYLAARIKTEGFRYRFRR